MAVEYPHHLPSDPEASEFNPSTLIDANLLLIDFDATECLIDNVEKDGKCLFIFKIIHAQRRRDNGRGRV